MPSPTGADLTLLGQPTEMIQHISSYLDDEAVTKLRFTCKRLEHITFDCFVEKCVAPHKHCIVLNRRRWERLLFAVEGRLGEYITGITFDFDDYDDIKHYERYKGQDAKEKNRLQQIVRQTRLDTPAPSKTPMDLPGRFCCMLRDLLRAVADAEIPIAELVVTPGLSGIPLDYVLNMYPKKLLNVLSMVGTLTFEAMFESESVALASTWEAKIEAASKKLAISE